MSLAHRKEKANRFEKSKPIKFPDEITINDYGFRLSENRRDNIITLQTRVDYEVHYLRGSTAGNKGSHYVVKLVAPGEEDDACPLIMKICAYDNDDNRNKNIVRLFKREITALIKAKDNKAQRVINLIEHGDAIIEGYYHQYYVMEYAESDLCNYLQEADVRTPQKVLICYDLLLGLKELHDINIYHRDIKHDNLLICNNQCKLADLGLMRWRDEDRLEFRSRLGAYGWESPEAINKYYEEREVDKDDYTPANDCIVDDKSDIFQLGKVFWFIFTGKIPIGQLSTEDIAQFVDNKDDAIEIFQFIRKMLHQDKQIRTNLEEAINEFESISKRFNLV
jgi:serine/threonine protein kinase